MNYDLVVVLKADEELKKAEDRLKAMIEKEGFTVRDLSVWGKKTLAYPIKKQDQGIYISMTVTSTSAKPAQIYTRFRLEDTVLRSLILKQEKPKVAKAS